MENNEIKTIVSEILDTKLTPIIKDVGDIKLKLNNHIEHFAYQFTEVKNDVSWLKRFFDPEASSERNNKNLERDTKSSADIAWLKWGVRIVIGAIVVEAVAIAAHIFLN